MHNYPLSVFKDNKEDPANVRSAALKVAACFGIALGLLGAAYLAEMDSPYGYMSKKSDRYKEHMQKLGFQQK